jgi:hypothetical protein
MTITTRIEECGIIVEFENDCFSIINEYNADHTDFNKINLRIGDLKVLEKIFEHYHKIKEVK